MIERATANQESESVSPNASQFEVVNLRPRVGMAY